MYCPYCQHTETKVIETRDSVGATKRRRECLKGEKGFNSLEEVEEVQLRVMKKDGRREDFDREKVRKGIVRACEKRPIGTEAIERMLVRIEEKLRMMGKEVHTHKIGELVARELKKADKVAYIRFASVYRDFTDLSDFKKEIRELVRK